MSDSLGCCFSLPGWIKEIGNEIVTDIIERRQEMKDLQEGDDLKLP